MQAKTEMYLWLGLNRQRKDFLSGLPNGFEENKAVKGPGMQSTPPISLIYTSRNLDIIWFILEISEMQSSAV